MIFTIGAVIQARMGSTRLPGKVLMDLNGSPVLWHVIHRVRQVPEIKRIIVATSNQARDDVVAVKARSWGVQVYRGDEQDVLDRYYRAAALNRLTTVVRITADCPLLDPDVVSQVIRLRMQTQCDYASNVHPPTYPDGLDVEVVTIEALQTAWDEAAQPFQREHVTPYVWQQPERFSAFNAESTGNVSHLRWTLDTPEDLIQIRALLSRLPPGVTDYRKLL